MNIENEVLGGLGIEDRTGVESTSMATTVSLMRGWQSWIQHREINLSLTMRKKVVVVANREIYNHEALKACLKEKHDFDCEVLAPLVLSTSVVFRGRTITPYDSRLLRKAFEKGSPDWKAAKEVAHFLRTLQTEFHFTVQEGLDAIPDVIYHVETYDVTTIRASTPMFLMSRKFWCFLEEALMNCLVDTFTSIRLQTKKNFIKRPAGRLASIAQAHSESAVNQ